VKYKTVQLFVLKAQCSVSVPAHIPVTVLVVQVVTFSIHQLAGVAQLYPLLPLVNTCHSVHHVGTSFTVTAHVLEFTEVTGKLILVSVIAVTCQSVLVVIVGTLVAVHLVV
jgi:hypothetical protein